jgi:hypothetical protein
MTDSRQSTTPLAWQRPLLALLAGVALAFGMAAPHDMAVELAGVGSRVEIAESAVHPNAPVHIEDAEVKLHPPCVACLLQLGSRTVLSRPPAPTPPDSQARELPAPSTRPATAEPSFPSPARAPPLSSPSA